MLRITRWATCWLGTLLVFTRSGAGGLCSPSVALAAPPVDFETQVAPILVKRCLECHNARDANAGLVLITADRGLQGGDTGPAWVPGKPADSTLLARVTAGEMPPPRQGQPRPLPEAEQQVLREWIAQGANWPAGRTLDLFETTNDVRAGRDFWSLQPLRTDPVPPGSHDNPIDAFIAARLEPAGLAPAPPASRETLLRRVMYDLVGLPPTRAEIERFVSDPDPWAYERLVDRLLASPQFGERWARHWLDLVRFAETCGYERDQTKPFAWKYRDWVVRALNSDLPYDRFVLEQLAGDELPDRTLDSVIATGFLRLGTWNDEPNDPQEYKYERLEDLVHASSSAFLGISVKCARCHDHKFDPVSQEDYYRFAGAFWPGAIEPRDGKLLGGPTAEELGYPEVLGWADVRVNPPPLHLFRKGDPKQPLAPVEPGPLSFLPRFEHGDAAPAAEEGAARATTGRRLRLARWLIDPANPLTPRVIVNRLWQHHLGQGLVRSPNDFGFNGAPPTHPELLDWLAGQLLANGWRLKPLHRQIVLSQTYRQSALGADPERGQRVDAANTLWWRSERRRRDAEGLRDALLSVTGELDPTVGGESFKPAIASEALEGLSRKSGAWQPSSAAAQRRRSLYIFSQRSLLPPLMTVFDFADTTLPCAQRDVTTVAPQALALLNNEFVHERSTALARRVRAEAGEELAAQARMAWQRALGRDPAADELRAAVAHLRAQQAQFADAAPARSVPTPSDPCRVPGLVVELRADRGVIADAEGLISEWRDGSGQGHSATQPESATRPRLVAKGWGGRPVVRFAGQKEWLKLAGSPLTGQACTIVAVANDEGAGSHREIVSNWNGSAGNSTTSLFLGTTGEGQVRFSDDFSPAGRLTQPRQPFVLTASNSSSGVRVWQNGEELGSRGSALAPRNLATDWVLGTQGNIQGEYWQGGLAELLIYDRELTAAELRAIHAALLDRYQLQPPQPPRSPAELALASLCHVLLNTNEFLYVD